MCLAVPGKVISIDGEEAVVDFGGVRKKANVTFLDELQVGEFVLIHAGFAIQKVDKEHAEEALGSMHENIR